MISSEIFESIFKEATSEIQKETGKVVARPGLKPKPKPEVKAKPEAKPKAPTKLELEPKEEPKPKAELLQEKPRSEAKPRIQPPLFKSRQDPIRRPVTRPSGSEEEEKRDGVLSVGPLVRSRIQEQKPKEEPSGRLKKLKPFKKRRKGSPVLKIILLLVLLAAGVGGASVYLEIIDVSEYIGWSEPAKKEAPKVAETKSPPAQPAAKPPEHPVQKPAQPAQPQAKPAEAPKQPVQPPPVQPPQAPPKPAVKEPKHEVTIAIVGKYTGLKDSYKSLIEALTHGGIANDARVNLQWIDSEEVDVHGPERYLSEVDGILVPGGFGYRG